MHIYHYYERFLLDRWSPTMDSHPPGGKRVEGGNRRPYRNHHELTPEQTRMSLDDLEILFKPHRNDENTADQLRNSGPSSSPGGASHENTR